MKWTFPITCAGLLHQEMLRGRDGVAEKEKGLEENQAMQEGQRWHGERTED